MWVVVAGCARGPDFPDRPLLSVDGDAGLVHVDVRSDPQPPEEGVVAFQYVVTRADGGATDGLRLDVAPYMPLMEMGVTVVPTVVPEGDGVFVIENVDLVMPGVWELQSTFSGAVDDYVAPRFEVP